MMHKLVKLLKPYFAAIISVSIAILALSVVSLISMIGSYEINKELNGMGLNGLSISAYNENNENVTDTILYENVISYSDITHHTPVLYDYATITFQNSNESTVMCWGIAPTAKDLVNLDIVSGKMFSDFDVQNRNNVCLIDEELALLNYGRTNIVGKNIYLSVGTSIYQFEIIGIVKKTSSILNGLSGDFIPNFIYIPYSVMGNMTYKSNVDQILINVENADDAESKVLNFMLDNIQFSSPTTLKVSNLTKQRDSINNIVNLAFLALFAVSCVAIIVCCISVATSVNTAVSIKQRDIGIKISLGASILDIMLEFMTYSIFACIIGVVFGLVTGMILLITINTILGYSYNFDYLILFFGIFITLFLSIIFSLLPSWKAAKLTPVKALNRE